MLELMRLLGEYSDHIVVVGGWVPELLITQAPEPHTGSIDVDLAVNHLTMPESGYKSILELLQDHGYRRGKQPFIFHRTVKINDREMDVEVDFLAGEYAGTGNSHRTQRVQDLQPRKARGADLAFERPAVITLEGELPEKGKDRAHIRVASLPSFLIMKGFALGDRLKEKDAWDIYYCLRYFPGGLEAIIRELQPILKNELCREALGIIDEKFSNVDSIGPVLIANFEEMTDEQERATVQRDAYERVRALLDGLGFE
ncbi:MAG: nucleotidyl transferase AbiEii/AbiGii toxin family protein [Anaerolineales bacterium]